MPVNAHRSGGFLTPDCPRRGSEAAVSDTRMSVHGSPGGGTRGLGNPRSNNAKDAEIWALAKKLK